MNWSNKFHKFFIILFIILQSEYIVQVLCDCCYPRENGLCDDGEKPAKYYCGWSLCDEYGCNCGGGCRRQLLGKMWNAQLYKDPNFDNALDYFFSDDDVTCVNLTFVKVSSINSYGSCVKLYDQAGCQGDFVVFEDGSLHHSDISNLKFEYRSKSLSSCRFHRPVVITTTTTTSTIQDKIQILDELESRIQQRFQPPSSPPEEPQNFIPFIIGVSVAFIAIVFLLLTLFCFWTKKILKKNSRDLTMEEITEFHINPIPIAIENENNYNNYAYNFAFEISDNEFQIDESKVLGKGQFGRVLLGTFKGLKVAVKTTNKNAHVDFFKALLSEIKIISQIDKHPNVVEFLGAYTRDISKRKLYLLMELCQESLLKHLRENSESFTNLFLNRDLLHIQYENSFTTFNMVQWAYQIANGMAFLSSKNIIHGDLAARNVLLFDRNCAKISDFGLSKQLYNYQVYVRDSKTHLPWAWLSIESIKSGEFSTTSDIWAYGVTLWEIFSLGQRPYSAYTFSPGFIQEIDSGMRLEMPIHSNGEIYNLMLSCWSPVKLDRPSFTQCLDYFKNLMEIYQPNQNAYLKLKQDMN